MSCNVAVWIAQGVAKPSPSSLYNVYAYLNLNCSLPEVLIPKFVRPLYSKKLPWSVATTEKLCPAVDAPAYFSDRVYMAFVKEDILLSD